MKPGDVFQITREDHDYFPALGIIDVKTSWGYKAYLLQVMARNDVRVVPLRLEANDIIYVGEAKAYIGDENG